MDKILFSLLVAGVSFAGIESASAMDMGNEYGNVGKAKKTTSRAKSKGMNTFPQSEMSSAPVDADYKPSASVKKVRLHYKAEKAKNSESISSEENSGLENSSPTFMKSRGPHPLDILAGCAYQEFINEEKAQSLHSIKMPHNKGARDINKTTLKITIKKPLPLSEKLPNNILAKVSTPLSPVKVNATAFRCNETRSMASSYSFPVNNGTQGASPFAKPFNLGPVPIAGPDKILTGGSRNRQHISALRKDVNQFPRTSTTQNVQKPHNLGDNSQGSVKSFNLKNLYAYPGKYRIFGNRVLREVVAVPSSRHSNDKHYLKVSIEGGKLFALDNRNNKVPCILGNKNSFSSVYIFSEKRNNKK